MTKGTSIMPIEQKDEYLPTRVSLLGRLRDIDDQESWRDFFDTYWKLIYNTAIKAGLSPADAEDVVQETVLTVTKRIKQLKYDAALGSFKGWLLNTTRWRIADHFRKRKDHQNQVHRPPQDDTARTSTIDRIPDNFDWDSVWERDWQKNLVDVAVERVKREVSPQQFQIFDLYVLREWPVKKVAKTLGVSSTQVYLAKHRVSALLKKKLSDLNTRLF